MLLPYPPSRWLLRAVPLCGRLSQQRHLSSLKSVYKQALIRGQLEKQQVANILANNIVFHEPVKTNDGHGIVGINKPPGLPVEAIRNALPALSDKLDVEKLVHVKSPERYISGVTILATEDKLVKRIAKSFRQGRASGCLMDRYLCITQGVPRKSKEFDYVSCTFKEVPTRSPTISKVNKELVVTRANLSNKQRKAREYRSYRVYCEVVTRSGVEPAALVSVEPTSNLSPILGDWMFSYRVKTLMGRNVPVGLEHSPLTQHQALPAQMLKVLELRKGEEDIIPKQLHLARCHLPNCLGKGKDLTIYAPPPNHMMQTMKKLQLHVDVQSLYDEDSPRKLLIKKEYDRAQLQKKLEEKDRGEHVIEVTHTVIPT